MRPSTCPRPRSVDTVSSTGVDTPKAICGSLTEASAHRRSTRQGLKACRPSSPTRRYARRDDSSTAGNQALAVIIRDGGVSMGAGKATHSCSSVSQTRTGWVSEWPPHGARSIPPARVAVHQPRTMVRRSASPKGSPPLRGRARRNRQNASRAPAEPWARSQDSRTERSRPE